MNSYMTQTFHTFGLSSVFLLLLLKLDLYSCITRQMHAVLKDGFVGNAVCQLTIEPKIHNQSGRQLY